MTSKWTTGCPILVAAPQSAGHAASEYAGSAPRRLRAVLRDRRRLERNHRHDNRGQHQRRSDQVREVVAGVERGGGRLAIGQQAVGALARKRGEHGQPDRAAHLHARVDEP